MNQVAESQPCKEEEEEYLSQNQFPKNCQARITQPREK